MLAALSHTSSGKMTPRFSTPQEHHSAVMHAWVTTTFSQRHMRMGHVVDGMTLECGCCTKTVQPPGPYVDVSRLTYRRLAVLLDGYGASDTPSVTQLSNFT